MRQLTLELSTEQRAELERTRDRDHRAYMRECAAALLKVADGQSAHQVANHALNNKRQADTLYRWIRKYKSDGLAGLVHKQRGHRGFSPSAGRRVAGAGSPTS